MFPALLYTFFITSVKYSTDTTVWKYENFAAIHLLHEIKFAKFLDFSKSETGKIAILSNCKVTTSDFT